MIEIIHRYDPEATDPKRRPANAEQAQARLTEGNRQLAQFWNGIHDSREPHRTVIPFDLAGFGIRHGSDGHPQQEPFAAVLSCCDARVPTELIFHQSMNDLYVVRLAGNVVSGEVVGSIAYALRHLNDNIKLLVVLGHSGCGAVTAAVDTYLTPSKYPEVTPDAGLRSIVDRIFVAVRVAARSLDQAVRDTKQDEASYRDQLIDLSVIVNSALAAMTLRKLLADVISVDCKVVFGIYDMARRTVFAPHESVDPQHWQEPALADPPNSFQELEALAERIAGIRAT